MPRRAPGSRVGPTSTDVARRAKVSQKTVSRVLNDEPYVTPAVRQRVLDAAKDLDYRLNNAARVLASGRTNSIGVICLDTNLYGPSSLVNGIARSVRDSRFDLRVVSTVEGEHDSVPRAIQTLLNQGVDGIIVAEPIDDGGESIQVDVPVLVFGAPPFFVAPHVLTAGVSSDLLAQKATEHLLKLGHTTVHHLAGPQQWFSARDRLEGWRSALVAAGRPVPHVLAGDWSAASGFRLGQQLAAETELTAVFVGNDEMAIGLIRALVEVGRRIPEDVSVVGLDDIPVAAYLTPPLTTIRQPFDRAAADGLALLLTAIETPDTKPAKLVQPPVQLIERQSAASPPPPRKRGRQPNVISRSV